MKTLISFAVFACSVFAQVQSTATFDNFSAGNRTRTGSSSSRINVDCSGYNGSPGNSNCIVNQVWGLIGGGVSGSFTFQRQIFGGGQMITDFRLPRTRVPLTVTSATLGTSGRVRLAIHNHDLTYFEGAGTLHLYINVSGVTCTGTGSDCGSTGKWQADADEYEPGVAMSGTNTVNLTAQPFHNGDSVYLANCFGVISGSPTANSMHRFTVANALTNSFDLQGFSGDLCRSVLQIFDNEHLELDATSFTGAYVSGGTAQAVAIGVDLYASGTPWSSGPGQTLLFQGNLQSGAWDADSNRVRVQLTCDHDEISNPSWAQGLRGGNGWNMGTYSAANIALLSGLQGQHFYLYSGANTYANRKIYFDFTRTFNHNNSNIGGVTNEFMDDFSYWVNGYGPTAAHYWDTLKEFYIDNGPDPFAAPAGGACKWENVTVARVAHETDTYIGAFAAMYNGSGYEATWQSPPYTPISTHYDVRCDSSGGSFHTNGWSAGVSCGSVNSVANWGYSDVTWHNTASQVPHMTIAVRPTMPVWGVSGLGASPIVVTPYRGSDFQTGDTVTMAGVRNVTNGDYTVTRIDPIRFSGYENTWLDYSVTGGVATAHVTSTTGLVPGMTLQIWQVGGGLNTASDNRSIVLSVVDSSHFTFSTGAGDAGTTTISQSTTCIGCAVMATYPAMSLNGTTGSGSASATGETAGTVRAADASTTGFYEFTLDADTPQVTPFSVPEGLTSTAYSQTLTPINFSGPVTLSLLSGTPPTGLSFNAGTGVLSGTPTTLTGASPVAFTIRATDGTTTLDTPYVMDVADPIGPTVSPSSLPPGTVGVSYSQTLAASTFSGTVTWSLVSGAAPTGLSGTCLSGTTGTTCTITGTPTTTSGSPFSFRIRATDGTSTVNTDYTVTISPAGTAPTITTTSLAAGTVGSAYSQTLAATGDTPITWTVTTGAIPAWASLNASTGAITGTPNAAAVTSFTVTAANGTAPNDTKALSITITAAVTVKGSRSGVRSSGVRQ